MRNHDEGFYQSGPAGGLGGTEFLAYPPDDDDGPYRIVSISGFTSSLVEGLTFVWRNQQGQGGSAPLGGTIGTPFTFNLGADEYLAGLVGTLGWNNDTVKVFSIGFITNKKATEQYGQVTDVKFRFLAPPGWQVLGLVGRAGSEIDAIGVAYAPAPVG